jgi:hypothetical protein
MKFLASIGVRGLRESPAAVRDDRLRRPPASLQRMLVVCDQDDSAVVPLHGSNAASFLY